MYNHRRDDMSRLASSRNVQWSEEGATKLVYPVAQNISSFRSGSFDETTKKMKFFSKTENLYFWQKPEVVILHVENFDSTKIAFILASLCEGEWFSYLFSVLRKISCNLEKKFRIFFITLFAQKNPERKKRRRQI